jgi:hypothetical protein
MKVFIKWFAIVSVLILVLVCADINFNSSKVSPFDGNQLKILNLATTAIVVLLIIRLFILRKLLKKKN